VGIERDVDVSIQSETDRIGLSRVGKVVSQTLRKLKPHVRPGVTTVELNALAATTLSQHGARSAPFLVYGIPAAVLISLNEEAAHGLPGTRTLQPGDLVKLDVTAELDGYIADAAITVALAPISPTKRRLRDCAESAFRHALRVARAGHRVRDIGRAVEAEVRRHGFSVIRDLYGHGVGRTIHEEPTIPNYYDRTRTQPLTEGLVITIEPMITSGTGELVVGEDGWTARTSDGCPAAHYEHTLVITRDRPILLTA
jgi:methionyl aminopeptidase